MSIAPKKKTEKIRSDVDRVPCSNFTNHVAPMRGPAVNAAHLDEHGYVVICVPWFSGKQNACRLRKELEQEVLQFPEFTVHPSFANVSKYPGNAKKYNDALPFQRYGLGGTSFLGAASVFHNRLVRKLRDQVMHTLIERLFRAYVRDILRDTTHEYKLQQLVDRIMIRPTGDKADAESWHRDTAPGMNADKTFGGWINLDTESQYFGCVPGTHKKHLHTSEPYERRSGDKGFGPIKKDHHHLYAAAKQIIEIPPGCILVFQEDVVHEVMAIELKYTTVRQFFGWRLTKQSNVTLKSDAIGRSLTNAEFITMMHEQAVIPLKSGQNPEMYPRNFNTYNINKVGARWKKFKRENMVPNVMPPESEKGKNAYMKSLADLHAEGSISRMHPPYEHHEIQMLLPNKTFRLTNPRTGHREVVSLHDESDSENEFDDAITPYERAHPVRGITREDGTDIEGNTDVEEGDDEPMTAEQAAFLQQRNLPRFPKGYTLKGKRPIKTRKASPRSSSSQKKRGGFAKKQAP